MYIKTVFFMIITWFAGLFLDANIGYGDYCGITGFRVLFPLIAMAICILSEIKKINHDKEKPSE